MTPDEITAAYDVLSQDVADYTANEAAKVGNSQRSLGKLAEAVASPSGQTSGLANYTYDRTIRPTVNSLTASLTTTGKAQALSQYLNDNLRAAKKAYEDAQYAAATKSNTTGDTGDNYDEDVQDSSDVSGTGYKSEMFNYSDGNTSYTGVVYYDDNGNVVGVETPYISYDTTGAKNYINTNSGYMTFPSGTNVDDLVTPSETSGSTGILEIISGSVVQGGL